MKSMSLEEFRKTRSQANMSAILNAALEVFRRDGYARASMEEIAKVAQVSTATLYKHATSKAALFEAVAVDSLRALETTDLDESIPPLKRLRELALAYANLLATPEIRGLMRMLIAETGRGGEIGERFYNEVKTNISAAFTETVAACIKAGAVKRVSDIQETSGQLQGMIEHPTLMRGLILGDDAVPIRETKHIAEAAMKTWLARYGK